MKTTTAMLALSLFLLLDAAPTAQASIIFITTDTTINTSPSGLTGTVVGYTSMSNAANMIDPTSPNVNLVTGGSTAGLVVYNDSVFTMSGGNTANVILHNNVSFSESGGTVGGALSADDNNLVNISGGSVAGLNSGGTSTVNVTGGSISANLTAGSTGTVNFSGGSVGGQLFANGSGTINYSGGTVTGLNEFGYNNVLYEGDGSSVLNIYGTGLSINLVGSNQPYDVYELSGQLMDGTSLDGGLLFLNTEGDPQVNLFNAAVVPEPSSLTLMGLGVAGLAASAWRRRKSAKA